MNLEVWFTLLGGVVNLAFLAYICFVAVKLRAKLNLVDQKLVYLNNLAERQLRATTSRQSAASITTRDGLMTPPQMPHPRHTPSNGPRHSTLATGGAQRPIRRVWRGGDYDDAEK